MPRQTLRASFLRSGTSKGLFLRLSDLPKDVNDWTPIILSAVGSPDPYLRQLDGVGGGSSTTSKVVVVGPPEDPSISDLDYTFIQVPLNAPYLDFSGNCGNMSAGVAPFAVDQGLFYVDPLYDGEVTVRIRNTNTGKILLSTFKVSEGTPVEEGDLEIPGVPGVSAPVRVDFLQPSGSMTGVLLPTGNKRDMLSIPLSSKDTFPGDTAEAISQVFKIECSMVDAANPFVFISARSLGLRGDESATELEGVAPLVQLIRAHASIAMGIKSTLPEAIRQMGCPKIAILSHPTSFTSTAGLTYSDTEIDITTRAFSMGFPHPTIQMTGAICLAAASSIPGTIPHEIAAAARALRGEPSSASKLKIAHLGGIIVADSNVRRDATVPAGIDVVSGSLYRTVRLLMEGVVYYKTPLLRRDAGVGERKRTGKRLNDPITPPDSDAGDEITVS